MKHSQSDSGRSPTSGETVAAAPQVPSPNAARRRLLLGAGAVLPSVYTLSSGATTAASSTLACFANPGTAPARFVDTQDKWYRSQVYDGKAGGKAAHCVTSPQNVCSDGNGGGNAGSVWIKSDGQRMVAGAGNPVKNVGSKPQAYALVYVDQNGTVNTLDPNNNTSLSYASIACWNSIMGARISTLG